jgi:glutamate formiminotransferase/formiminotetrahydrofolate cyclodeaminase
METAFPGFALIREMVEKGNPNSVTDAAVGALALRSCIRGAFLNVKINVSGLDDRELATGLLRKGQLIESEAISEEEAILKKTEEIISKSR